MLQPKWLMELPTELLDGIIRELRTSDICSLRLTCRVFNSFVSPVLFRSLTLRPDLLAKSENSNIAPYVHNLKMSWPWPGLGESEDNVEAGDDVIAIHLLSLIKKLENLQSISWDYSSHYYNQTPDMYLQQVELALAGLSSLKDVNIEISLYNPEDPTPNIQVFKDLDSLHVAKRSTSGIAELLNGVMRAVAASPMLKSFHLNTISDNDSPNFDSLVDDWKIWRPNTTLALQDLELVGIPMQLSVELRHIFQNLKHLTLAHGSEYHASSCSTMKSIAWADIWNGLHDAGNMDGLWLETLDTEGVQPESGMTALFNYLRSHPGLKKLCIRHPPYQRVNTGRGVYGEASSSDRTDDVSQAAFEAEMNRNRQRATEFWCEIVPRHAHSLRELSVVPLKQGPWSYCQHASTAIRQCTLLRKLKVSISDVDGDWALEKATNFEMADWRPASTSMQWTSIYWNRGSDVENVVWGGLSTCPVLLASDLGSLPLLEEVQITAAEPDRNWGWCGTGMMEQKQVLLWQSERTLERWVPPKGYPHELVGDRGIIKINGMRY